MDLLKNPFHILTASPRDNRRRIMELADERCLLLDSNEVMEAQSDLTNSRKRLSSEIAWLPGIGPKRANELLSILESSPTDVLDVEKISSIARANLLAAALARFSGQDFVEVEEVEGWILEIASVFEEIFPEELRKIINEERVASGFPEVSDLSAVEAEIQERRRHYLKVIKSALDNLKPQELVELVTLIVESVTDDGEEQGPVLIADLVDSYEIEATEFLDREEENIKILVEKLWGAVDAEQSDSVLTSMVNKLIQVVKNWDTVAQPIQVSAKSRGLNHNASHRIANLVRDLAIHMYNEHGKIVFSQQLTGMLQEVFAEVGEVAERTAEDADALEEIEEQRARLMEDAKKRAEEWRKEITYDADVGAIFKNTLSISPEGIEWKGRHWNLDSITRIRWGGTRHSINGISTGTTYSIFVGDSSNYTSIELKKGTVYNNFVDCLWRAVGVRLLTEYLEGLRNGKKYNFGSAVLSDHGMELERKNFFGSNEQVFCRWEELVIWNGSGTFCIRKKEDKKIASAFSYEEDDNIHVLEAAIRMLWKQGGDTLSSLLKG